MSLGAPVAPGLEVTATSAKLALTLATTGGAKVEVRGELHCPS